MSAIDLAPSRADLRHRAAGGIATGLSRRAAARIAGLMLAVVAIPSVVGEGWLGVWLLRRGFSRRHAGT